METPYYWELSSRIEPSTSRNSRPVSAANGRWTKIESGHASDHRRFLQLYREPISRIKLSMVKVCPYEARSRNLPLVYSSEMTFNIPQLPRKCVARGRIAFLTSVTIISTMGTLFFAPGNLYTRQRRLHLPLIRPRVNRRSFSIPYRY